MTNIFFFKTNRAAACALLAVAFFASFSEIANAQATSTALASIKPASFTSISRSSATVGAIDVEGKSDPRTTVNLELISDEQGPVMRSQTTANEAGEWRVTVGDASFPNGAYTLRAIVQDSRGLLGPVTEVRGYKVQASPLLSIGGIDFGWLDAFLLLLLLTFFLLAFGGWYYEHNKRKHEEHTLMTERDMNAMSYSLLSEVDRLDHLIKESKTMDPHVAAEAEYILKNQHATLEKMQGYLSASVEKARN
jgi:hypothetical protein